MVDEIVKFMDEEIDIIRIEKKLDALTKKVAQLEAKVNGEYWESGKRGN